jgi:hypothetical protein
MIRMGLWGISTRATAWCFVWLSIVSAVGCIAYGFLNPIFFLGAIWLLAALWYFHAIRWVDRHSKWNVNRSQTAEQAAP